MTGSIVDLLVAAPDHVDAYCPGEYSDLHGRFNGGVRAGGSLPADAGDVRDPGRRRRHVPAVHHGDAYDREVSPNHSGGIGFAVREWMRPPRPHGDVIEGRTVSFLELFYDLVFVVFVSQVARALAAHPDGQGVRGFVVLFTLVWYTWLNGTLYHDLHGSDDGRSRIYMFVQMSLIALMSVYAGGAAYDAGDGRRFAVLLAVLLVWLTYQWWVVQG
jgi:hypothetical protein